MKPENLGRVGILFQSLKGILVDFGWLYLLTDAYLLFQSLKGILVDFGYKRGNLRGFSLKFQSLKGILVDFGVDRQGEKGETESFNP